MQNKACSVAIAGIGVTLYCNEQVLLTALQTRYQAFRSETATFSLYIERSASLLPPGILDADIRYHNGLVLLQSTGYSGSIDLAALTATLQLGASGAFEEVEYFLRVIYALLVFQAGGLLFHAAGIVRDGQCYLFFGHSGSGKTTVARLSSTDLVLNDDLVVLFPTDFQWIAYATPFYNPTQVEPTGPHAAPIKALLRLVQDTTVYLEPIGTGRAVAELVASAPIIPLVPELNRHLITRSLALLNSTQAYRLHFLPDASFWPMVLDDHRPNVRTVDI